MRVEVLKQFFFACSLRRPDGSINPAPPEAVKCYVFLRETWLKTHPKTTEIPSVVLKPVSDPKEGYEVVTQIFIPPIKVPPRESESPFSK
jgi:hypothetical protein